MRVDKTVISTMNKQNVINIIRTNGPIYKAEISRITGLSVPTVMKITDDFITRGLVRETGKGESSGGKPPQLLDFVPDAFYIIGVDIGTTNISVILMNLTAKIVDSQIIPMYITESPDSVINRIIETISTIFAQSGINKDKLLGVGVGMPGLLDMNTGTVLFSPDFGWENVNLIEPLKKKLNMNIIMDNVTRAMAMGEKWFGLARGINNFVCVNLGYGIGAVIVLNGELYSGNSGSSGEFGHITLEKNGPLCDCGNYGCLEALASANAISKKAKFYIGRGEKSTITDMVKGNIDSIEAKTVFDAAKTGDRLALEIVHEAIEYLGISIAGLINLLDPELIVLEGGVAKAGDILVENLEKVVNRRRMRHAGKNTRIVISELGSNAAAVGAASLLLKKFIENGCVYESM